MDYDQKQNFDYTKLLPFLNYQILLNVNQLETNLLSKKVIKSHIKLSQEHTKQYREEDFLHLRAYKEYTPDKHPNVINLNKILFPSLIQLHKLLPKVFLSCIYNNRSPFLPLEKYIAQHQFDIFPHIFNHSSFYIDYLIYDYFMQKSFSISSYLFGLFIFLPNYELAIYECRCFCYPFLQYLQVFLDLDIIFDLLFNQTIIIQSFRINKKRQFDMTSTHNNNITAQQTSSNSLSSTPTIVFPTIEINDAGIKFNAYLTRLTNPQQKDDTKCKKIVRLSFQTFMKYQQCEDFVKSAYEILKTTIYNKRSYYLLYLFDLMIKNNKYFIKNAKKDVESMFKNIWEKIWTEYQNQEKIQNMKVMVKCWGWIYGEKVQENIRKWLQGKYNLKKIQLTQQNEAQLKQVYGVHEKPQRDQQKFNQLLMTTLDDQKDRKMQSSISVPSIQKKKSNSLLQMLDIQ